MTGVSCSPATNSLCVHFSRDLKEDDDAQERELLVQAIRAHDGNPPPPTDPDAA